ncbi:hypothetical protein EBQ93_02200 [bacterium]|nr:hypothetical protein [bacterium]
MAALQKQAQQRSALWTSAFSAAVLYGYTLKNLEIARKNPMYTLGLFGAAYLVSNSSKLGLDAWTSEEFMKARRAEGWGSRGWSGILYNLGSDVYNANPANLINNALENPLQTLALAVAVIEVVKYMGSKKAAEAVVPAAIAAA